MTPNRELIRTALERIANGRPVRIDKLLELLAVELPTEAELDRMAASQQILIESLTAVELEVGKAYSEAAATIGRKMIARRTPGNPSSASKN